MVETYARPRFGVPREPKNRVNPGSRLAGALDFVTGSHVRAVAFLTLCGLLLFLPGFFNIPPIDRDEAARVEGARTVTSCPSFRSSSAFQPAVERQQRSCSDGSFAVSITPR